MNTGCLFALGRGWISAYFIAFTLLLLLTHPACGQGVGEPRSEGLDLTPVKLSGMPGPPGAPVGGRSTLNVSSRMFPDIWPAIPGLEISYLHSFGRNDNWSRLLVEYVRPVRLGFNSTVYGEIHGTFHDPLRDWSWSEGGSDISAGGGYRRRFDDRAIVGFHGFYDATRRGDDWTSSFSAGGFMLAMLPGQDAIDLTVNWYGGVNTGMVGPIWGKGTFDATMTYYHQLWKGGPDLQLSLIGYGVGYELSPVFQRESGYGGRVLAASPDGMFRGFYMYENDRLHREVHTVGAHLNIGFRLENLLAGESPFEKPTPIFASPRNLDYWQNVAAGTERPLRKLIQPGAHKCNWGDCKACWNAILWYFFHTSCPDTGDGPNCDCWIDDMWDKVYSDPKCSDCSDCVYTVQTGCGDNVIELVIKMNVAWHLDPECCNCKLSDCD